MQRYAFSTTYTIVGMLKNVKSIKIFDDAEI